MKRKLFILGFLSLAGLLLTTGMVEAWHRKRWRHCHESVFICRPYNAFTPVCYGTTYCDGCCPPCFNPCMPQMACMPSFQPWCAPACDPCLPGGHGHVAPSHPASTPPPPVAGPGMTMAPMSPIYQAGYQPNYYPGYYPMPGHYPGYYPQYPMGYPMSYMPNYGYGR